MLSSQEIFFNKCRHKDFLMKAQTKRIHDQWATKKNGYSQLLGGIFSRCLLQPFGLWYGSIMWFLYWLFCPRDLSPDDISVLKPPMIVVSWIICPFRSNNIHFMKLYEHWVSQCSRNNICFHLCEGFLHLLVCNNVLSLFWLSFPWVLFLQTWVQLLLLILGSWLHCI